MNYRPIKLFFIVLSLFISMSPLPIILAAPTYQATATLTPVLTSTRQILPLECSEIYTVQPTETLSKLAQRFYGAAVYFTAIVEATNIKSLNDSTFEPIVDNGRLKVGQKLCIISTNDLPLISRTGSDLIIQATLTTVVKVNVSTPSPILNQPIAPTLKIGEQVIEVPTDKAALTAENLSPVEIVFDLIGPSGQSYVIAPSQKWPIILEPGRYSFNIHSATGRTGEIAVAPGSFEIRASQLAELVIFARSVQFNLRDMIAPATSTAANFNPTRLNTATPPVIATLPQTVITVTIPRPVTTPLTTPTNSPAQTATSTATGIIPGPVTPVAETPATNTPQPAVTPTSSPPQATPTIMPTSPVNTATPQPASTPTIAPSLTVPNTATSQPTSTATVAPTPTTAARPTDDNSTEAKEKLAPPLGQGRLYFQNFYRETANIELNNQAIAVEVEMIKMIDLPPKTYSFRVTVAKGAGQGEIDLAANHSWLVRLDPNGGLGWVQVYP